MGDGSEAAATTLWKLWVFFTPNVVPKPQSYAAAAAKTSNKTFYKTLYKTFYKTLYRRLRGGGRGGGDAKSFFFSKKRGNYRTLVA